MKRSSFEFRFVEYIPKQLEEGVLYVSMGFATASHRCFCGCGMKVVTPLSPTDWRLIFNGDAVSLEPSIGNWSYPCRSHYVLRGNRVLWAGSMTSARIDMIRAHDRAAKDRYFAKAPAPLPAQAVVVAPDTPQSVEVGSHPPSGPWTALVRWFTVK